MSLITLLVTVCLIIFALWLVVTFLPAPWKTPLLVLIVILALVWIATLLVPGLTSMRVTR